MYGIKIAKYIHQLSEEVLVIATVTQRQYTHLSSFLSD